MNQQGISDPQLLSNPRMIIPQQSEIIYELYIQSKNAIAEDMLIWLDSVLIKEMLSYEGFLAAKLFTLINDDSKSHSRKYTYYSVQFLVESIDLLNNYLTNYGDKFRLDAAAKYGKQFTEERRILSFQKFYTYDTTFNPNTNTVSNVSSNPILTTEPITNRQVAPGSEKKKGLMSNIKAFFGFNRQREANLLVENSNVSNLRPNPVLAKNITQVNYVQNEPQKEIDPNIANRDKNLYFGGSDKGSDHSSNRSDRNLNRNNFSNNEVVVERVNDNQYADNKGTVLTHDPYERDLNKFSNNYVYDANQPNQNLNIDRKEYNYNYSYNNPEDKTISTKREVVMVSDKNDNDLSFKEREQIKKPKEESYQESDYESKTKNIISDQENDVTITTNKSNREAMNLGTFPNNPITDFNDNVIKDTTFDSQNDNRIGEKDINYNKDSVWSKDFIECVKTGDKDFPEKNNDRDVNFDYTKNVLNKETYMGVYDKDLKPDYDIGKDKKKGDVIVEHTTEVRDNNDNQKYLSKDFYVGTINKDKLEYIENDFKKDIFASPSDREYTVANDYEDKENDINLNNINMRKENEENYGKNDYLDKDLNKYSSEKYKSGFENKNKTDDVI